MTDRKDKRLLALHAALSLEHTRSTGLGAYPGGCPHTRPDQAGGNVRIHFTFIFPDRGNNGSAFRNRRDDVARCIYRRILSPSHIFRIGRCPKTSQQMRDTDSVTKKWL